MFAQRPQSLPSQASPAASPTTPATRSASPTHARSVIGHDLKIVGQGLQIISQGILQVDGEVIGDVHGAEVIVGSQGKVTGKVTGQHVDVCGSVVGVVSGNAVVLKSSSVVDGDIHHLSLVIETGAQFDGRSRRVANEADLAALLVVQPTADVRG